MMCGVVQRSLGNVKLVQAMINQCLCNIQVWSGVAHVPSLSALFACCMSAPMYCMSFFEWSIYSVDELREYERVEGWEGNVAVSPPR